MAISVGIGLSTNRDVITAAKEAVAQARISIGEKKIHLAILFTSVEHAQPQVLETITSLIGHIPLIGCSTLAVIHNQGVFRHGLSIMLIHLPENIYFNTDCVQGVGAGEALNAGENFADKLLYGFKNIRRDFGITFSDGLLQDGSQLLSGLQQRLGISFPLIGASASDNLAFKKTFVYFKDTVLNAAACGILWGGRMHFGLGTQHGWEPLGKPRIVTRSKGNVVLEIDNTPAVGIYEQYFAKKIQELKKDLKRISILYPIGIYVSGEKEYLLRNILHIEDSGAVIFQGDVPEGSQIRLMIGTKESCLRATREAVEQVKTQLSSRTINFVLVFDSVSRYIVLGRDAHKELDIVKEVLGNEIPVLGLYTYGEQAPLRAITYLGRTYFHNQTFTILGIAG